MSKASFSAFAEQLEAQYGIVNLEPYKPSVSFLGFSYYTATDAGSGKKLFLKKDASGGQAAEREARLLSRLSSCNERGHFPYLHCFKPTGDHPFVAVQFIQGITLRRCKKEKRWERADYRLCLLKQLQHILSVLQKTQIIHRDARPDNFMVTETEGNHPRLILIDFAFSISNTGEEARELPYFIKHQGLLRELGGKYKPDAMTWDDAYAFGLIADWIETDCKSVHPEIWSSINARRHKLTYAYKQ